MLPSDSDAYRDSTLPDVDWAVLPPGARISRFEAPSGSLAVASQGDPSAPRVVLVPGVTGSKEDFWYLFPLLAEAGLFVESFDLAGQYESAAAGPRGPSGRWSYELFADDLIAFLEAGSSPAHLLGYSFAGIVAEAVAVRRPDLVASLALLSTPPLTGQSFRGVRILGPISWLCTPRMGAQLMKWGILANVQRVPPGRQRFVTERFESTSGDAHVEIMGLMMRVPDLIDPVAALDIPKALAVGEHDLWPLRLHRRYAGRIGASIAVYRSGHSPSETAPHQLTRDLVALVEKATASVPPPAAAAAALAPDDAPPDDATAIPPED